jgi:hypothetical protein
LIWKRVNFELDLDGKIVRLGSVLVY